MTTEVHARPAASPTETAIDDRAHEAMRRALDNLARRQTERGSWDGDYGGPMFLLPMYVALCHVAAQPIDPRHGARMVEHVFNVQNADGSIGLHAEGPGRMFTTALTYAAVRMLGASADEPRVARMRAWIHAHGTPLAAAQWGKFTLCWLGLYGWEGLHPIPPELWLLPYATPFHPGRLWCHCRQVYLPMAWLYGTRATAPLTETVRALRRELYDRPYETIRFADHRDTVAPCDNYRPHTPLMRAANAALGALEGRVPRALRSRALAEVVTHIAYEDRATNDIDIGPVNAVLNTVVHHFRAPGGADFRRGFATLGQYLWDGHDGMKMQGYNSSELWDTAFAIQAVAASPLADAPAADAVLRRAYDYLRDNQILDDVPEPARHYRHASRGGWPFSNRAHGWPITDCTSEGLTCALALEGRGFGPEIPADLLRDSVRLILSWQNDDGGWSSYERKRGGAWLEQLNPSQVFGDIMVDYSFVECTSACVQALVRARRRFPGEFDREIDRAVARGAAFLRAQQRPDGSFEGAWAVCFTYGTWFGVSGLLAAGATREDAAVRAAGAFLLRHQNPDGSWGEDGASCEQRRWVPHPAGGHVVNTSWALSTLARAGCRDAAAMQRAAAWLVGAQDADGSWPRQTMVGVFNRTCLITYDNYRHYFPLWALAEWRAAAART